MGATTWIYYIDYEGDPATALHRLQEQVFRSGAFQKPRASGPTDSEVEERLRQIEKNFERERQVLMDAKQQLQALVDAGQILYQVPTFTNETLTPEYIKQRYLEVVEKMRRQPARQFRSIGGLRKLCGADGTHSILDIRRVSAKPAAFSAAPLKGQELERLFGTTHPSASAIERKVEEIAELREPWSAAYILAFEQDKPSAIYFVGVTGD